MSRSIEKFIQAERFVDRQTLLTDIEDVKRQYADEKSARFKKKMRHVKKNATGIWSSSKSSIAIFSRIEGYSPLSIKYELEEQKRKKKEEKKKEKREVRQRRREIRKERKELRKRQRQEVFVAILQKTSKEANKQKFKGLTLYRRHFGSRGGLFKEEKDFFKNRPVDNLRSPKTWKQLESEGLDARAIFAEGIQNRIFPKEIIKALARTAKKKGQRDAFLEAGQEIEAAINGLLGRSLVESGFFGVSKASLVGLAAQTEISLTSLSLWLLGVTTDFSSSSVDTEGQFGNEITRIGREKVALPLRDHVLDHRPALSGRTVSEKDKFSYEQIEAIMCSQIFFAGKIIGEQRILKQKMRATIRGIIGMHLMNIISADSGSRLVKMGEATIAAVASYLVYRHLRKRTAKMDAPSVEIYEKLHKLYREEMQEMIKEVEAKSEDSSHDSLSAEKRRRIKEYRKDLNDLLNVRSREKQTARSRIIWGIIGGSQGGSYLLDKIFPEDISVAGPVVTAMLLVEVLDTITQNDFYWQRLINEHDYEIERIKAYLEQIQSAPRRIISYEEKEEMRASLREQKVKEVKTYDDYGRIELEPVIIEQVSLGLLAEKKIKIKEGEPIYLQPGTVSVISLGDVTEDFARTVTLDQGDIAGIKITKGAEADFRLFEDDLGLLYRSNASSPLGRRTMSEEIKEFVLDPRSNLFKKELENMHTVTKQMAVYSYLFNHPYPILATEMRQWEQWTAQTLVTVAPILERVVDTLLSDDPKKEEWIDAWVKNPSLGRNAGTIEDDKAIAGAVLNLASTYFLSRVLQPKDVPAYLREVQGASEGTNSQEAALWRIRTSFTNLQRAMIVADVAGCTDDTSAIKVAKLLEEYVQENPGAVILLIDPDKKIIDRLRKMRHKYEEKKLLDKMIVRAEESTDTNIIVEAKPLDSSIQI